MDNYYAIFNIDENLHGDELQTELRKIQKRLITRQNAADINRRQEAERKLVLIQEAMDILLDEEKRKEYDAQLIHANHKKQTITNQKEEEINKQQEEEHKLVLIQEAIDILLDEEKRKEYDAQLIHANHKKQTDSKQHHQEADSQYNHQSQQELIDLAHDL